MSRFAAVPNTTPQIEEALHWYEWVRISDGIAGRKARILARTDFRYKVRKDWLAHPEKAEAQILERDRFVVEFSRALTSPCRCPREGCRDELARREAATAS